MISDAILGSSRKNGIVETDDCSKQYAFEQLLKWLSAPKSDILFCYDNVFLLTEDQRLPCEGKNCKFESVFVVEHHDSSPNTQHTTYKIMFLCSKHS